MAVLVLRLAGPLQSWGTDSKYNRRSGGTEPSKSGVIGMIAAAMGRSREEPVDDLARLRFGVRKDQVGTIITDYHTAHMAGKSEDSFVTYRQYLTDSIFLVALEGENEDLNGIQKALESPIYPLYLGRRSCPPCGRICLGIHDGTLVDVLDGFEWQASEWYRRRMEKQLRLEMIMDSEEGYEINDLPLSFDQNHRRFGRRTVTFRYCDRVIDNPIGKERFGKTGHDAMAALRG